MQAAKKMVIKNEPPQLTNFTTTTSTTTPTTTKLNKPNICTTLPVRTETIDQKTVQIPMPEYLELLNQLGQLKELKDRVARLEDHCEKSGGFIRNRSTSHH